MGIRKRIKETLADPEVRSLLDNAFAGTPQGALFQAGKAIKQQRIERNAPPAPPPPPFVPTAQQAPGVEARRIRESQPQQPRLATPFQGRGPIDRSWTKPVPIQKVEPTQQPARTLAPHQQRVTEAMHAQNVALGRIPPPATTAEIAQQAPSAVAPAETRTNKRKGKGGLGAFGMNLINLDLPK